MLNKSALASAFDEVMEHHLAFKLNAQECHALTNKFGLGPVSTAFLQEAAALVMALANTALSCQPLAAIFVNDAGKRKLAEIMGQEFVPAPLLLEPLAQSWACPLTFGEAVVGTEYSRSYDSGFSSAWQQGLGDDTTAAQSVSYSPDSESMTGVSSGNEEETAALQQLPDTSSKPEPVSGLSQNTVGYNALPEDVTSGADGVMSWQHSYDTPWAEGFSEYLADSYTVKSSSEALVGDVFVGNELPFEPEPEPDPEPETESQGEEVVAEEPVATQVKTEADQSSAGKVKLPHGERRKIRAAKKAAKKAARREALLKAQAKQQAQQAAAAAASTQQDKSTSQVDEPTSVQNKVAENSPQSTTEGVSVATPASSAADSVASKAAEAAVGNEANSTTPENTPEGTPVDAATDSAASNTADTDAGKASSAAAATSAASQQRQGKKASVRNSTKQQSAATPAPDEPSREAVLLLGWMLFVLTYGNSALVGIQNALLLVLKTFGVIDLEDLKLIAGRKRVSFEKSLLIAGRKRVSFEKSLLLLEDLGKIALVDGKVVWLAPPDDFDLFSQPLYPLEEKRKNGLRGAERHLPIVLEIGALSEGLLSQTGVNILAAISHYKAVNAEQLRLALRLKKSNFARAVSVLVCLEVLVEHEGNLYLVPRSKVKPTTLVNRYHKQQQEEQLKLQRQLQAQERAAQREAQKAAAAAAKEAEKAKAAQEKAKAKELAAKQKSKEKAKAKAKKAKEASKAKLKAQAAKQKAKAKKQVKSPCAYAHGFLPF